MLLLLFSLTSHRPSPTGTDSSLTVSSRAVLGMLCCAVGGRGAWTWEPRRTTSARWQTVSQADGTTPPPEMPPQAAHKQNVDHEAVRLARQSLYECLRLTPSRRCCALHPAAVCSCCLQPLRRTRRATSPFSRPRRSGSEKHGPAICSRRGRLASVCLATELCTGRLMCNLSEPAVCARGPHAKTGSSNGNDNKTACSKPPKQDGNCFCR